MGKRKMPPCFDNTPCSAGSEIPSSKKSSLVHDSSTLKPISPRMDVKHRGVKLLNQHQHYNVGRSAFLKPSRHYHGHYYSRRNSASPSNASTSHGKNASLHDEIFPFKSSSRSVSQFEHHTDSKGKACGRPDRIRANSFETDASDAGKFCGICQKLLRRKPYFLGDALSSGECSIVAVLVCGHVYHAECLEHKTSFEERQDPSCPRCSSLLCQNETSREQE